MAARWMLVLLLLVHPVRGVLAMPARPAVPPVSQCGGPGMGCCPLCDALDACPCATDPGPGELPEPVTPPTAPDGPRMVAALDGSVAVDADRATSVSLKIHGARAPPAQRASVNAFLSVVCVWTI
jgi:hypothetical protein